NIGVTAFLSEESGLNQTALPVLLLLPPSNPLPFKYISHYTFYLWYLCGIIVMQYKKCTSCQQTFFYLTVYHRGSISMLDFCLVSGVL
ncbi:MAG TPA: hypothetical protein VFC27_04675, partial [Anaerovoracaceae bacterium]|nr:hypothetical protein [Anaerovoracaceae bacterium]